MTTNPKSKTCAQCGSESLPPSSTATYCKDCSRNRSLTASKLWRLNNPMKVKLSQMKVADAVKLEAISHYGRDSQPLCNSCGFSDIGALCLDHINNDGAEHRKTVRSGKETYAWAKRNNYPPIFQTLCANCNMIKSSKFKRHKAISPCK